MSESRCPLEESLELLHELFTPVEPVKWPMPAYDGAIACLPSPRVGLLDRSRTVDEQRTSRLKPGSTALQSQCQGNQWYGQDVDWRHEPLKGLMLRHEIAYEWTQKRTCNPRQQWSPSILPILTTRVPWSGSTILLVPRSAD